MAEVIDINSNTSGETGCIANKLPGKAMRVAMENKGLLTEKNSLYYGTGETTTVEEKDSDGNGYTCTIPVTAALEPPSSSGTYYLAVVNGVMQWVTR